MLASAAALYFVGDVRLAPASGLRNALAFCGETFARWRAAIPLFTIVLVMSPIGAGAMNNLWSAVAPDWRARSRQGRVCQWIAERSR